MCRRTALEVLPGLAGQAHVREPLEILVGHAGHVGRPKSSQSSVLPLRCVAQTRYETPSRRKSVAIVISYSFPSETVEIATIRTNETERPLPPLARHRPLRAALWVPRPDTEHPAPRGPRRALPTSPCAAPVCSGSRAALLTGQCTHATGMLGLAHARLRLLHPERHIVNVLREAGYWTGLVGEQHVSGDPGALGTTMSSTSARRG